MFPVFAQDPLTDIAHDSGKRIAVSAVVAVLSAVASFLIGRYWGRWKANRAWEAKDFLNRVIVSLNIFADGALKIRTVMERSLDDVFLNQIAIEKVLSAARRCTPEEAILPLAPKDRWYLLNFALNAVAEHFAAGLVRLDAGVPVTTVRYALFLTAELVGEERLRKVRAMVVKQEHLLAFPYPDSLPTLENPWHADRVKTLRKAAELYAREPDNFIVLEVYV